MSAEKTEALRLADELDGMPVNEFYEALGDKAAAELRRLHAQRDALLEALKLARSIIGHPDDAHTQMIDAAIKAAEGETT